MYMEFFYQINGAEYKVNVIHKRIKRIYYRFRDNEFYISCHPLTSKKTLLIGLDKFAPTLIKKNSKESPIGKDYIYLYGTKVNITYPGSITFNNGVMEFKDEKDLSKKLKKQFLEAITKRTRYFSEIMKLPSYKVSVRNMKSRWGSNSKQTKSIHYSIMLIHYSWDIIDSVIVHELAHIEVYNHSRKFYDVVYKYYPNYQLYRKKLLRGIYQ